MRHFDFAQCRRLLAASLFLLALGAPSMAGRSGRQVLLRSMFLRMTPPQGWSLNETGAVNGWVSLYSDAVKDPEEASIDVFFYGKDEPDGSPARYLDRLEAELKHAAAERADAPMHLERGSRKVGGREALTARVDYTTALPVHAVDIHRVLCRDSYVVLPHPRGIVVLRLQSARRTHPENEKTLLELATSVEPI